MALISQDTARLGNVLKYEFDPASGYCREVAVVNEASETVLKPGTVLGKTLTGGTGTPTAGGSNTGDGTMGTVTVGGTAQKGTYKLTIVKAATNAGDFVLADPQGDVVGYGTVGVAFSAGGLSFTLADGATDFVVGDTFTIAVTGTYKYKVVTAAATDGSQTAAAVVVEASNVTAAAATDTSVLAIVRGFSIWAKEALVLGADIDTDAEKQAVYDAMATFGAIVSDQE